jgi:hypothetical protein
MISMTALLYIFPLAGLALTLAFFLASAEVEE